MEREARLKSRMTLRAATHTALSLLLLYIARSLSSSAVMTSGARRATSLTAFSPTAITSGRARSWTNALTSWRTRGAMASGGTSSWHA